MNKSYSKIRHIQESNLKLEKTFLFEKTTPRKNVTGATPGESELEKSFNANTSRVSIPNTTSNKNVTGATSGKSVPMNTVAKPGNSWKATTSYNIGRVGFDQVLNSGSIFYRVQGQPGTTASCTNPPFSQDDPLFFTCNPINNNIDEEEGKLYWLYENTFGIKIAYYNQQLVIALGKAFCPNGKANRT